MNDQLDRITYSREFTDKVAGRLYARFVLDTNGEPSYEPGDADPNVRSYLIDLYLYSARAREIDTVVYYLLDSTFTEQELWSEDERNDFRAGIQTHSDVRIEITAKILNISYKQRTTLSAMLENGHAESTNPAIRAAIDRLKLLGG